MTDEPSLSWFCRAPYDVNLARVDPLLVRFGGTGARELGVFLEDLIAWNAGIRHYASASAGYIQAKKFPDAAKCALSVSPADSGRGRVLEQVVEAWQDWQEGIQRRLNSRVEVINHFQASGCDPRLVTQLDQIFEGIGAKLQRLRIVPEGAKERSLEFIAETKDADIRSIDDDIAYLDLACEDCEKDIAQRATRLEQEVASIRQQSARFVSTMLSESGLTPQQRERAFQLAVKISNHLDSGESALASQALSELKALTDFRAPGIGPAHVFREASAATRPWELSAPTNTELSAVSSQDPPIEFPESLEDPPGWEWNQQKLEQARVVAHALASAKDGRYRERALGPFLAIRAKQRLLSENPGQALAFFREAYSWSVHSPTWLRAPARWRNDCAWGVLLSVILAFHPANDPRLNDRARILSPQNLEALFNREIGPLPLAIIEDMQLFSDVAHHILAMDRESGEQFIRDHLWEYLSVRPIALREFAEGLTLDLPEQADKVLSALCVLLRRSGDASDRDAAEAVWSLIERARDSGSDKRKLRYVLDEARNALRTAADNSNLAESLIEGIEARLRAAGDSAEPRITVRIITNNEGAGSRKRLALRISYGTGDDILRGVQISTRLETQQAKAIENALETNVPLGHLIPGEVRELGISFRPDADLKQASLVAVNLGRRDTNGVLHNVELNGSRSRFPTLQPAKSGPQRNPYIVGKAIMNAQQIFGRNREISEIARRLIGQSQDNVVLVLGERRIGKTTVLNGLRSSPEIRQRYIVTYTDMESAGDFADTVVFYNSYLIEPIRKSLLEARISLEEVSHENLSSSPHRSFENFMMRVDEKLKRENRRLLIILDELEKVFEEIERRPEDGSLGLPEEVVAALRAVILSSSQISFVLAGITDVVRRHLRTSKARLFNLALEVELTTLPRPAAVELISAAVRDVYAVTPRAENQIVTETNCHPYLLQKVCHELFQYMIEIGEVVSTEADVAHVLDTKVLPQGQPFAYLIETIRRPDDMVLIDALSFMQSGTRYVSVADLRRHLLRTGVDHEEATIKARLDDLRDQAPSLLERAPNNVHRYRVSVRLFARHRRLRQVTQQSLLVVRDMSY